MTEPWHKIAFTEDLYHIPERSPEAKDTTSLPYEGQNLKNVLVLVPSALADDDRTFLGNIFKAVGYSLDDIALVVWDEELKTSITAQLSPVKVLCFGLPADPWTDATAYEVISHENVEHLLADALPVISADQNLKRRLWTGMKQLF